MCESREFGQLSLNFFTSILNNRLYLKFDRFIFYGERRETDMLSDILNILISETIQKSLYVDLNTYLPDYNDEIQINKDYSIITVNE